MSRRRKRVKPASRASDSAVAGVMPRVPRPAPPGSDSADDRHESTLMPYIIDAIGFFSAFSAKDSWALMSTSSQAPSSDSAPRLAAAMPAGSVLLYRQSNGPTRSALSSAGRGDGRGDWGGKSGV